MTSIEFRADRSRCSYLRRILEMPTFREAIAAAFADLDLTEAHLLNHNLNAGETMELRLINQRKGYNDLCNALRMMSEPIADAPPEITADYGAGEQQGELANAAWQPIQ